MNVESEIEKHLLASLFAKTAQLIESSSGKDVDEILARHQDYLVMILNYPKLLLGRKETASPLRGVGLGLAQAMSSLPPKLGNEAKPGKEAASTDTGSGT